MKNDMRYFDAHFHLFDDSTFGGTLAANIGDSADRDFFFNKYCSNGNMIGGILMGNGPLELQGKELPAGFYYCLGLDDEKYLEDFDRTPDIIENHLKESKCVGVKLYPGYIARYPNDEIYYPLFELLCKYNKVLAIHTGMLAGAGGKLKYANPIYLDDIAADFPRLRIVMCHFGNPFLSEAAAVMEKNPNVYADLSGLIEGDFNIRAFCKSEKNYIKALKTWIQYIGTYNRFMFGTDWPAVNGKKYCKFIASLFPKKYIDNVMYKNALEIYRIKEIL